MKKTIGGLFILAATMTAFTSNKGGDHNYTVDTKASKFEWIGKKVTGQHSGTVNIKSGNLEFKAGKLAGGSFEMDMTTISATDLEGEYKQKLDGHLKSEDFFGVDKFPTAKLVITKAETTGDKVKITGNLTIKGATHPITFDAAISQKDHQLTAKASFDINRAKYDVRYGSKSFFDDLGDKVIYDDFNVSITLVANAKH